MIIIRIATLLAILASMVACTDNPTTSQLTEDEINALIDARVAVEIAKMANEDTSLTPQEISQTALQSLVYIRIKTPAIDYTSSAFVVGDGLIATCSHNLDGMISGTAELVSTGEKQPFSDNVFLNTNADLAIVEVKGLSARALALGNSDEVQIGDPIFVAGNPRDWKGTFSDGIISSIRPNGYWIVKDEVFQITAPISLGSSGSPVLNQQAEVIGVLYASDVTGQNLNFAVPVNPLKKLLATIR